MAEQKRCLSCMQPVEADAASCPFCGYNGSQQNPAGCLPIGTRLGKGRFLSGKVSGVLPASVDYCGYDVEKLRVCTIREYMPQGACAREEGSLTIQPSSGSSESYKQGLSRFVPFHEKLITDDENSAVLRQYSCFAQNGTAYAVFEWFEGMTLKELLKKSGGTLTASQTMIVMSPVLDALSLIHSKGICHAAVCPENILINTNGDVRLTGFADSIAAPVKSANGYLSPERAAGAAPTAIGDVYSAAAVFYRCLTGIAPQDSLQRANLDTLAPAAELEDSIPQNISHALWHAMLLSQTERTQSIEQFVKELAAPVDTPAEVQETQQEDPQPQTAEEEKNEKRKSRWKLACLISVCFLAVMLAVFVLSGVISRHRQQQLDAGVLSEIESNTAENTVQAPDYIGKNISSIIYDTLSFDYTLVSSYKEGAKEGEVVGQAPHPGSEMGRDDRGITLFVNREKDTTVILPDTVGYYSLNARQLLESLGVTVETEYEDSTEVQPGLVIKQSAEAGSEFLLCDTLVLTIAQRPQQ